MSFHLLRPPRNSSRFEYSDSDPALDHRHDDADFRGRPDCALSRSRIDEPCALRGRGDQSGLGALDRGRAQIFRSRRPVVGNAALRSIAGLWFYRYRDFRRHREGSGAGKFELRSLGLVFGLVFLFAGFCFKVSAVPFHMWTPDVYEGAPTPITAFFAAAPKVAGIAMFVRDDHHGVPGHRLAVAADRRVRRHCLDGARRICRDRSDATSSA